MAVSAERIQIASGGGNMSAYVAQPDGEARAAVIVIMEAFGLVPSIEKETERVAAMGYVAIAPDVYHRQGPDNTAGYDNLDKALGLMGKLDDAEYLDDMRSTIGCLRSRPDVGSASIGITGFCMGGRLSFLAARDLPREFKASAPFYGGGIGALLDRADQIQCPMHLFFGELDGFIPQEEVQQIDARLSALGLDYKLDNYKGADHGFLCEERPSYHPEVAKDAWSKLETFLAQNL